MVNIITVTSDKGGNGKTEFVKRISDYMVNTPAKILVVDLDVQRTLFEDYKNRFEGYSNLKIISATFEDLNDIENLVNESYDYCIFDTPPLLTFQEKALLLTISDQIIIPIDRYSFLHFSEMPTITFLREVKDDLSNIKLFTYDDETLIGIKKIYSNEEIRIASTKVIYGDDKEDKEMSYIKVINELVDF